MRSDEITFVRSLTRLIVIAIISAGLYEPLSLRAQEGMASLNGVVTDPSGAVIPSATVSLESASERAVRQTQTNSVGLYVISAILPGTYRLLVSAAGFETQTVDNLLFSSGQGSTLNISMKVGAANQQVTVTEKAPLLTTTTATLGATLNSQAITSLPLLGRNFTSLIPTMPGVVPIDYSRLNLSPNAVAVDPPIHGQRPRSNEYTIDGVLNDEVEFQGVPNYPPPEAIAEMKLSTGMDSGAYGFASGGNIDVVTKSGTNQYHGDVWEYLQNGSLNARSYFQPSVGAYQYNQFGGTFGGPLIIPHLLSKDKGWYVFGYYEGIRRHTNSAFYSFLPTAAELNGNFTGDAPIYNPFTTVTNPTTGASTRTQFANNIIPSGTTNVCAPQPTCINPTSQAIYGAFLPTANFPANIIPGEDYSGKTVARNVYDNWSARVDHQIGTNDTLFVRYSDARNPQASVSYATLPSLTTARYTNISVGETHTFGPSFVATFRSAMARSDERIFQTGNTNVAAQTGVLSVFGPFEGYNLVPPITISGITSITQSVQLYGPEYFFTESADVHKTHGHHTLTFGGEFYRAYFLADTSSSSETFNTLPTANFVTGTGNATASYLLGVPSAASRILGTYDSTRRGDAGGFYAQDSWQITPKLHFNFGLRWDIAPTLHSVKGESTFDYETGQFYWSTTNPVTGQPANIRPGLRPTQTHDFAPRIGLAYAINPRTVLRGSYGIFYDNFSISWAQTALSTRGQWPYSSAQNASTINTGLPTAFIQNPFVGLPPLQPGTPSSPTQTMEINPDNTHIGQTQEWSASVQRQLTATTKLDLAYFGSHSAHLEGYINENTAVTPGTTSLASRGKLYPQYGTFGDVGYMGFPAFYDGLDVTFTKQYSRNLQFLATYTYSRVIDYEDENTDFKNGALDTTLYDIPRFRGVAQFDMTHRLAATYLYNLPGHAQNRWLNAVVSGWEHSGVVAVDSGNPQFVYLSTDNENIGIYEPEEFPNILCNPYQGWHRTDQQWFNTSCYQLPVYGTAGNLNKRGLYGPGEVNWDANFGKKWPFKETRDVEFRAEFFNLLNASTFANPGFLYASSSFGKINSTRQGGRIIQFALKIHF